jgi:predicted RNA binding protein with dsRBD fold (UPF0201 family)
VEEISVHVEAEINPTEKEEKVKTAVANMFGDLSMQVQPQVVGSVLIAEAGSRVVLENLRGALRRDRVRAAARKLFRSSARGNTLCFCLNKQVAFAGHVSFSQETSESPLGPIRVQIKNENMRELIDWLAPRTA